MLYTPAVFHESEVAKLHDHVSASGLATLVTTGADGPLISHVPLILNREPAPYGELIGHLARANPQSRLSDPGQPAIAVFMGPEL